MYQLTTPTTLPTARRNAMVVEANIRCTANCCKRKATRWSNLCGLCERQWLEDHRPVWGKPTKEQLAAAQAVVRDHYRDEIKSGVFDDWSGQIGRTFARPISTLVPPLAMRRYRTPKERLAPLRSALRRQPGIPAFGDRLQPSPHRPGNPGFSRISFGLRPPGWPTLADCEAAGEKTEDLPDFAGFLRSGDRRSVDESGPGSMGRRQQSLPPGCGKGKRRSRYHRRDHGEARRRSQAPGRIRRTLRRTCRTTQRSGQRRKTDENCPQAGRPQIEQTSYSSRRQGGGAESRSRLRTGAEAPRARTGEGRGRQAEGASTATAGHRQAQAALDKAEHEHTKRATAIQAEVEALAKRSQAEDARWDKEKERLKAALRRARG